MANEELLRILQNGPDDWNLWRKKNPGKQIDLREARLNGKSLIRADLRGVDLTKADLGGANLFEADLNGVDLIGADLTEADLSGANLSRAKLGKAYLGKAILRGANFFEADLSLANLSQSYLIDAFLVGANLSNANLTGSILCRADLSRANFFGSKINNADLNEANLSKANLVESDLHNSDIRRADLCEVNLCKANLAEANLSWSNLIGSNLDEANLRKANLNSSNLHMAHFFKADLKGSYFIRTNLCRAVIRETNLTEAIFVESNMIESIISGCEIYGISAWGLKLDGAEHTDLTITPPDQPKVIVDNIEVAQFIYLILQSEKIRGSIDTIARKSVLILGRFTPERKAILDALRKELRKRGYLPILFDFDKTTERDFTETIKILAGMSLFIIADISNPKSCSLELQATIPDYMIPFVPIIQEGEEPFSTFSDLPMKYKWVLPLREYDSCKSLIRYLDKAIIEPALQLHNKLLEERAKKQISFNVKDFE